MKFRILLVLTFLTFNCLAQDVIEYKGEKINALDRHGKPNGVWKVYFDEQDIVIVTVLDSGNVIDGPNYFKSGKLIASKKGDKLEIYEEEKTIVAEYSPKYLAVLIDDKGNELDKVKYKYLAWPIQPMYYDGTEALYKFIGQNLNYRLFKGQKGKVKVRFIVDKLGKTTEIKVVESTNPALNEEVMRVVNILPRFQPGHQSGKFARFAMELPVNID